MSVPPTPPPNPPMDIPAGDDEALMKEFDKLYWERRNSDAGSLAPFVWRLNNVLEDIDMPGIQESNGIPVKLHAVRIKGDLSSVLEDVVHGFEKGGLFMEPVLKQPQLTNETQVTALDWSRFISYTALIQPDRKSGTCMVVLGEANIGLASAMKKMGTPPDIVPVPASAKALIRSSTEGLKSLTFSVQMSEAEVHKYYSDEMKKRGYVEKDGAFEKGDELIRVRTKREPTELVVMVVRLTNPHENN